MGCYDRYRITETRTETDRRSDRTASTGGVEVGDTGGLSMLYVFLDVMKPISLITSLEVIVGHIKTTPEMSPHLYTARGLRTRRVALFVIQ